jgi:nucleoside-diphosphate-sugar epimerase
MKFVITGGAGFIGSNLVNFLLKNKKDQIVVIDNLVNGKIERINQSPNLEFINSDVLDLENYSQHLKDCDYLIHLACVQISKSNENVFLDLQTNSLSTLKILDYYSKNSNNLKKFIYTSSCSVYGSSKQLPFVESQTLIPSSFYASTKLLGENYTKIYSQDYKVPSLIIRYSNVYGYNQTPEDRVCGVIGKFIYQAIHNEPLTIFGGGEFIRDYTFIDDVIDATLMLCYSDKINGEIYNISNNVGYSVNEISELISKKLNFHNVISENKRIIDNIDKRIISYDKLKNEFGWEPKIDLSFGIDKTVQWFLDHEI